MSRTFKTLDEFKAFCSTLSNNEIKRCVMSRTIAGNFRVVITGVGQ